MIIFNYFVMAKIKKDKTLENFMKEFFPYSQFKKIGFFTKEMKDDYETQAKRMCDFFGFKTIYEYGSKEIRCHLSYAEDERPLIVNSDGKLQEEPFVTIIPSIYE
jgi:hypothetical protein